jgi:hypothetical protein
MNSVVLDATMRSLLDAGGISYRPLTGSERIKLEQQWRAVYGQAFRGRHRLRQGARADHEYAQEPAGRWLIIPLTSPVAGTAVHPFGAAVTGYECEGPPVPFGSACELEFAVAATDLSWTMLYTHEDHSLHGPYFVRREWLTGDPAEPSGVRDSAET